MKWALKIAAKVILTRLPISYAWWRSMGLFRHGRMDHSDYVFRIFQLHTSRAFSKGLPRGATVLELGPGDSIASAIIASAHGASQTLLVDSGDFARKDAQFYKDLAVEMAERGVPVPDLSRAVCFEEILEACHARYLTHGLSSLKGLPNDSVDFSWSHSVLEHVRKSEVISTLQELLRVMKPGAYSSHNIDFQDHLAGALNNLRFAESYWEGPLLSCSGFYTNRIPAVAMHRLFRESGFNLIEESFGRWNELPTPRKAMHRSFGVYSDEELCYRTSHILVKK